MKMTERFVRVGLILMIVLSFYLSYLIWLSPTNRDPVLVSENDAEVLENQNYKEASEIYLPLRLAHIQNNAITETNTENFVRKIQEQLSKARYGEESFKKYSSQEDFLNDSKMVDGIELSYIADMPIQTYLEIFKLKLSLSAEEEAFTFFKIQVDFSNEQIRFLNEQQQTILEVDMLSNLAVIQQVISDNSAEWMDVFRNTELVPNQLYTNKAMKLKMYSYISSTRPYTIFRDSFFSHPENVRSNDGTANLSLYDGSEAMIIQQNQQQVDFRGTISIEDEFSLYKESYNYIRGLGTNYGSMRLFDQNDLMADYRIFVEGYPVFSEQEEGQITVQFSEVEEKQANVEIKANLNTIQVPIPSDEEVELPASYDVLQNLYSQGAEAEKLEMIIVGYGWRNLQDTGVVDLEPNWYIQYDNTWYSYEVLLAHLKESEDQ